MAICIFNEHLIYTERTRRIFGLQGLSVKSYKILSIALIAGGPFFRTLRSRWGGGGRRQETRAESGGVPVGARLPAWLWRRRSSTLARISHPNDEKCARRAFAEMSCLISAKGLIFCALQKKRTKLWMQSFASKAGFSSRQKSMRKPG